ncbi:MAG TPA: cytochrome P450 [Anaerolineae bacterium]|nr:cytochrome P450 [Anaerolineae bacterium]
MLIDTKNSSVTLDPRDPDFYLNPYPAYARLQREAPIFYWQEFGTWAFVRHADVSAILRDRRFGRNITHRVSRAQLGWPPERADLKPFLDVDRYSLLELEPPDHTRLRGLVQKAFMTRQIERLRPRIAALSHQLIDAMLEKGQCDLLTDFATPIPVQVIAEMLGVPVEMSQALLDWSHAMVGMYQMARSAEQERAAVQAAQEFVAYLRGYVAQRRNDPRDDLITRLIQVEEAGEKMSEDELISTCILLLNAGHEATVNVIGNGVLALLRHPEQLAKWRQDPALTPTAIEELLRYDTPLHLFNRWVLEELEFGGQQFKQGQQISLLLGAANRDPAVFDSADTLDLARKPNPHLSFGGGIHYCLGAPLARLELQTALPILLERLPNLRLADQPQFSNSYHFHGLEALQIMTG